MFAVQEEIAQAIAASLRVPLGLQQGETLVSYRTGDLDSYQQYLRARALYRAFAYRRWSPFWNRSSPAIPDLRRLGRCCRELTPASRETCRD